MSAKFEILSSRNYSFQCSIFLVVYRKQKLVWFLSTTWDKFLFVMLQNYPNFMSHQVVNFEISLKVFISNSTKTHAISYKSSYQSQAGGSTLANSMTKLVRERQMSLCSTGVTMELSMK